MSSAVTVVSKLEITLKSRLTSDCYVLRLFLELRGALRALVLSQQYIEVTGLSI